MNEAEKEILQSSLSEEEKVLKFLKRTYERAKKECIEKIAQLSEKESLNPANLQSIIYQKKYQEVLLMQINSTLSNLQTDNYKTIDDYLNKCYEEGFTGALYSINKQGIPIIAPIDNKQVIQAIYNDTKLSQGLYERLGENVEELKISIKSNVSRGIVEGKSWTEVASGIANDMNTPFKKAMNNAMRIARTEGGRVQQQAQMDACRKAVARGADIVKQWDSTLDGRTRDSHRAMDGEVRELEEKFSNGLLHPKDKNGSAAEVVNCRCVMLQRARWALNDGSTKMNNFTKDIESFKSPKDYETFKKAFFSKENIQYMDFIEKMKSKYESVLNENHMSKTFENLLDVMYDSDFLEYKRLEMNNPIWNTRQYAENEKDWDRIVKSRRYAVESKVLSSRTFSDKFDSITDDNELNKEIRKNTIDILKHRSGQNGEDIIVVNLDNKTICVSKIGDKAGNVAYSEEMKEFIMDARKNKNVLLSIHNHPNSYPPSNNDINSAIEKGYSKGYTFGHNGTAYVYEINELTTPISDFEFSDKVDNNYKKKYTDNEAIYKALLELSGLHNFKIKELH